MYSIYKTFELNMLIHLNCSTKLWTLHFGSMRSPLDGEPAIFIWKIMIFIDEENDLESPLIFVLFFKG